MALSLGSEATKYSDEVSIENISTHVDTKTSSLRFNLRGVLGADWRVHTHFSLFTEYSLGISLVDSMRTESTITTTDSTGDEAQTTVQRSTSSQSLGPALGTDLNQGASLGVIAYF